MTDFFEQISALSPKRLALLALELKERLDASEERGNEPIAVVGLGCRFPGADSPDAFARLLDDGVDAIGEVPADRWDIDAYFNVDPDVPGTMNTRYGGFVDGIDRFDPAHFGISPREAAGMDPQQRLFLEVAWDALEHAGIAPDTLAGTQTGVFLGIATLDYASLMMQRSEASLDLYSSSGGSHAVAAGRLSYILGLHGPALSVDTACSSSLVAAHLACQSLRSGECDTAIVGGVNVLCAPETTLMLSRARMMAPDGRCKTFDESADGFVRGEGCGVLVLRRLSAAQAAGDRILAVIRGSAVNQDGRSSGLTAPNGPAQEAVIRAALINAGVAAADVDYVEAHGTGTALGDPIELRALGATYGAGRDARTALIASSVKTNFGHLEAAAGVAGLAKAILILQRERIPAHLHARTPTSHVDWSTLGVRLPNAGGEAWRRSERRRLAAVSSFGFSGTNAHVILEEAPPASPTGSAQAPRSLYLLPIAARTTTAVRALAGRYASYLDRNTSAAWPDVCDAASAGRSQLTGSRAVVLSPDAGAARNALLRIEQAGGPAQSEQVDRATVIAADAVVGSTADVAFVFTGQGGAQVGMGRTLYDDAPVFHAAITRLDPTFRVETGVSLIDVLYGSASAEFSRPEVSSTALVAFQIALAELWRSWGVEPAAVAGHSLGEYAAAVTAGVLSAADALRMVAARGRAVGALPEGAGAMAIVDAELSIIEEVVGTPIGAPHPLEIAARNAPEQFVLSGPTADIRRAEAALTARGIRVRPLGGVAHAYHSSQLDPILPGFREVCDAASFSVPAIEWVSCLTAEAQSASTPITAQYWIDQMRQPVQWRRVVDTLASGGVRVLIEIGPTAVLSGLSRASLEAAGVVAALSLPSLRIGVDAWSTLLDTLGRGWVRGMSVDWTHVVQGSGQRPALPTYPFQRERYWLPAPTMATRRAGISGAASRHGELLGRRLPGPVPTFPVAIDAAAPQVLREHVVHGNALFAGSAFIDVALAAAASVIGERGVELRDVRFLAPLEVGTGDREACVTVETRDDGDLSIALSSRTVESDTDAPWLRVARATAVSGVFTQGRHTEPAVLMATLPEALEQNAVYQAFLARGITLGPSVRAVQKLWRRDGESLSRLEVPSTVPAAEYRAALLDGALQTLGVAAPNFHDTASSAPRVLSRIGAVRITGDLANASWCHATLTPGTGSAAWAGTLHLLDAAGTVIAECSDLVLVAAAPLAATDSLTYALQWKPVALPQTTAVECDALATIAGSSLDALGATNDFEQYDRLIPVLEAVATNFAQRAFDALGLDAIGLDATAGTLADADLHAVLPQHRRLVRRLASVLSRAGGSADAPDATIRDGVRDFGGGELDLLERCGPALADVLRGRENPLQLLFPQGAFAALDRLYRDSSFARTYNGALRDVVRAEVQSRNGAPLRVLEIGAGTGGTTGYVLDVLPAGSTYLFTDLSPLFLDRARERFGSHEHVQYQLLDIETDPLAQGIALQSFDLIIASNVLHATADLRRTLAHVRQLAAPGAMVLLLEGTVPMVWVDLTFGLTEGWWRFSDEALRPEHPLITAAQWSTLLRDAGFDDVASAAANGSGGARMDAQALIFARSPSIPNTTNALPLLVIGDADGIGTALRDSLETHSVEVSVLPSSELNEEQIALAVAAFRARHTEPVGIVYLGALDVTGGVAQNDDAVDFAVTRTETLPLAVTRAVAAPQGAVACLWMVSRGAQSVSASGEVLFPEQAPLWGWARGFALEYPGNCGACIDLDPHGRAEDAAQEIAREIGSSGVEDQVATRNGVRYVARLVQQPAPAPVESRLRGDGAYLVTGGTGGLGLRVAAWLAAHGAGELILLSRTGLPDDPSDGRVAEVEALRQAGCTVHIVRGDVSDVGFMRSMMARFGADWRPLRGVVHTAVEMSSAPINALDLPMLRSMRQSKVHSTRLLDQLTGDSALDFFVLFSSSTSLLGVHGLAHYSAANQYLEALAHHRRARGQASLAIAWGTWDVMRIASEEEQRSIARGGLRQLQSSRALDLLARLMGSGQSVAMVADVDWQTLVPLYESKRTRPLIHDLAGVPTAAPVAAMPERAAKEAPLAAVRMARADDRGALFERLVRSEVATVLGYSSGDGIPIDRGFFELGLDSLMSVELKRRLETAVERQLPSTLTFNYPNIAALSVFLEEELFPKVAAIAATSAVPSQVQPGPAGSSTVDELNDDEIEAELLARLDRLR